MKNGSATLEAPAVSHPIILQDEMLYEIVNGKYVELPMSIYAIWIASYLSQCLGPYAKEHRLGIVVSEALFIIDPVKDIRRRPDVAFVSAATWPLDRPLPETGDWQVIPDLTVEVVSPNDLFEEVLKKMREYFNYGVKQVWIISPASQQIHIYDSPTQPRILGIDQDLEGGTLLPGFRMPVSSLFQQQTKSMEERA
jgi:Uma2 family endonuclease